MSSIEEKNHSLTDSNFDQEVNQYKGYVMVDFWASWCGPCKQLIPLIDQLDSELGDKIKIRKMNIDDNKEVPAKLAIRAIPSLVLFKDGEVIDTKLGVMPYSVLKNWVEEKCLISE